MEKDDEIKSDNNSYTSFWRFYDPRIARWLSLDPMMRNFPHQSPYTAFDNNPVRLSDPNGNCTSCPNNELGAPVAQEGDLTDDSFRVNSDWVAQNKDNNFQYRNESDRQGYNFYWVPNGGDYDYKRDEKGNLIPKPGGGYETERQGAYYATPYIYVNQNVMIDPGSPAQPAVPATAGTPAQFGWVPNPAGSTTGSTPGFSSGASIAANLGWETPKLATARATDAANPAVTHSNYRLIVTFQQPTADVASINVVNSLGAALGIPVVPRYDPSTSNPGFFAGNFNYNKQLTWIITPNVWQQTAPAIPGTPAQPAVPAVPPTFQQQWNWVKR